MELKIITIKDYLELDFEKQSEYNFFMKYSIVLNTPVDHFKLKDMSEKQTFGMIKDLQQDMSTGINFYQVIEYLEKLTGKKLLSEKLDKICQQWKYVISEIDRIIEIENIALAYKATDEEKKAGIDILSKLGVYLQFRNIAQAINLTINEVKNMPYLEAFTELVTQKRLNDYEIELTKIRSRKK